MAYTSIREFHSRSFSYSHADARNDFSDSNERKVHFPQDLRWPRLYIQSNHKPLTHEVKLADTTFVCFSEVLCNEFLSTREFAGDSIPWHQVRSHTLNTLTFVISGWVGSSVRVVGSIWLEMEWTINFKKCRAPLFDGRRTRSWF